MSQGNTWCFCVSISLICFMLIFIASISKIKSKSKDFQFQLTSCVLSCHGAVSQPALCSNFFLSPHKLHHRIIEFVLEGTISTTWFHSPAVGRDTSTRTGCSDMMSCGSEEIPLRSINYPGSPLGFPSPKSHLLPKVHVPTRTRTKLSIVAEGCIGHWEAATCKWRGEGGSWGWAVPGGWKHGKTKPQLLFVVSAAG